MDPSALLSDLDPAQVEAVTTPSHLVAVIAGAGSGKTRVLTRRVAYRIATDTATADHTLVLTFTREAAGELRRRLPALGMRDNVTAGTFHSICRKLLGQHWEDTGRRAPTLRHDRRRILQSVVSSPNGFEPIVAEVNFAATRGWTSAEFLDAVRDGRHRPRIEADRVVAAIDAYTQEKRDRNIIDLDDLLAETVRLLATDPTFADPVRWRYRHLLVDEAQDLNPLQQQLIDGLRVGSDDLFLVGDPAQAIYGFNGADAGLLQSVGDHFPGIEVIRLPTNHRCTPQIVAAGRHALDRSGIDSEVTSGRDTGPLVSIVESADESAEAASIADAIAATDPTKVRRGDVAVLARTHAALDEVRTELAARGLPMRFDADAGGSAYAPHLRQLYRLATVDQIRAWVQDHAEVAEETGDDALGAVVEVAMHFLREQPTGSGADFEAWLDATNPLGQKASGVELVTFHAAKGREWDTVHLVGVETGLVPHRSATTRDAKLEEARLLYVAITRATDSLVIHHAVRRGGYQRALTPLLDGFESTAPPLAPPPAELLHRRADEAVARRAALEAWRAHKARSASILPAQVLTDQQLALLADSPPTSAREMDELLGIGKITASALFDGVSAACALTLDLTAPIQMSD